MSDSPPAEPPSAEDMPARYLLAFLTDQWEAELVADSLDQARAAAKAALETLVRDETPALACVTVLEDGVKVGVWDWVQMAAHWTRL